MVAPVVLVAVGGACGAVLRWSVAPSPDAEGVPWGTLGVNLLGSLLLGAMTVLLAEAVLSREQALALGTGLLGAFTTMSTFSFETIELWNEDKIKAIGYAIFTVMICPVLAFVGWRIVESTS